jgi:hypothetical protein
LASKCGGSAAGDRRGGSAAVTAAAIASFFMSDRRVNAVPMGVDRLMRMLPVILTVLGF